MINGLAKVHSAALSTVDKPAANLNVSLIPVDLSIVKLESSSQQRVFEIDMEPELPPTKRLLKRWTKETDAEVDSECPSPSYSPAPSITPSEYIHELYGSPHSSDYETDTDVCGHHDPWMVLSTVSSNISSAIAFGMKPMKSDLRTDMVPKKIYNGSVDIGCDIDGYWSVSCLDFAGGAYVFGTSNGLVRRLYPSTLNRMVTPDTNRPGLDLFTGNRINSIRVYDYRSWLICDRVGVWIYSLQSLKRLNLRPMENPLYVGKTSLGHMIIDTLGYVYTVVDVFGVAELHLLGRYANSIGSAVCVDLVRADEFKEVLLALSCCNSIAIVRIVLCNGTREAVVLNQFECLDQSDEGYLIAGNDKYLFITPSKADRETAIIYAYTWEKLANRSVFSRVDYDQLNIPSDSIDSIEVNGDYIVVVSDRDLVLVFDAHTLEPHYTLLMPDHVRIAHFYRGAIISVTDPYFKTRRLMIKRLPKRHSVCDDCEIDFNCRVFDSRDRLRFKHFYVCSHYFD